MRYFGLFLLTILMVSSASVEGTNSESVITILGVPIGGKVGPLTQCPDDSNKSKSICWISDPHVSKNGSRLGTIHLPGADRRPQWAAYALFEAHISKKGILERLQLRTHDAKSQDEIMEAVTARLGRPTQKPLVGPQTFSTSWIGKEVAVRMLCSYGEFCTLDIASPAWWSRYQRDMEEQRKIDAARPNKI